MTRRTERDRIIDTQYLLASLGYLKPQNFSGRLGNETQTAIKAFQKANGLRETGAFTDDLARKVHEVAGKPEPPAGHLFVRQEFRSVFDAPIAFLDPERSLGTHVFTALGFAPGSGEAQWMAISLEGGDPAKVLDRIQIPDDLRQEISERLTAGSSLIVADTSVNSAILSEGEDFVVLAKVTPATAAVEPQETDPKPATTKKAKPKQAKAARLRRRRRNPRLRPSLRSRSRGSVPQGALSIAPICTGVLGCFVDGSRMGAAFREGGAMFGWRRRGTIIGRGLRVVGKVTAEGLVKVHGQIEGELQCATLTLARTLSSAERSKPQGDHRG